MKTYAQVQRKAEQLRAIEHGRIYKGKRSGLRHQTSDVNAVLQGAFKVKEEKIVADVMDDNLRNRVFQNPTNEYLNNVSSATDDRVRTQIVKDHRDAFAFKQLAPYFSLDSSQQVLSWLGQDNKKEHIYLYKDSNLYGGISGFDNAVNKNPHPTILGGDPEVDFAGIMDIQKSPGGDKTNTIVINNDSGHYPITFENTCGGAKNKLSTIAEHHSIQSVKAR